MSNHVIMHLLLTKTTHVAQPELANSYNM